MSNVIDQFLHEIGFDPNDPVVRAAAEDAAAQSQLIQTLTRHREASGLRQREVASRMETTQSRVSSFERLGGDPRLSTVFRYARAVDARVRFVVTPTVTGWEPVDLDVAPAPTASGSFQASADAWIPVPA